jgi:hypothetical protein
VQASADAWQEVQQPELHAT